LTVYRVAVESELAKRRAAVRPEAPPELASVGPTPSRPRTLSAFQTIHELMVRRPCGMTFREYLRHLVRETWSKSYATTRGIVFLVINVVSPMILAMIDSAAIRHLVAYGWVIVLVVFILVLLRDLFFTSYKMLGEREQSLETSHIARDDEFQKEKTALLAQNQSLVTNLDNARNEVDALRSRLDRRAEIRSQRNCIAEISLSGTVLFTRSISDGEVADWISDYLLWVSKSTLRLTSEVSTEAAIRFVDPTSRRPSFIEDQRRHRNGPHLNGLIELDSRMANLNNLLAHLPQPTAA
jgi:hypothetical protein